MAAIALSMSTLPTRPRLVASRRVDFHLRGSALSRWKYRQVDCFICASEAIRTMLVGDGVARRRTVTVHEGIDLARVAAAPPAELHKELWLPHDAPIVGNVAALVPHKGQKHLIDAARASCCVTCPTPAFVIAGEGELQAALEHQIKHHHLEKHVILAGFRPDVLSLHKAFDIFVMSSVTEGPGHVAARRDGLRAAGGRDQRRRDSRKSSSTARPGSSCRRATRGAGGGDRAADLGPRRCASKWAPPAWRAFSSTFSAEHMVRNTLSVYERRTQSRLKLGCTLDSNAVREDRFGVEEC